jgi:hypothetical protein
MANTPLKRIRVEDALWEEFGAATEALGSNRTQVLVGFMRRYVSAASVNQSASVVQEGDPGPSPV